MSSSHTAGKSLRRQRIQKARDQRREDWSRARYLHCLTDLSYRQWCHPFMRVRELATELAPDGVMR